MRSPQQLAAAVMTTIGIVALSMTAISSSAQHRDVTSVQHRNVNKARARARDLSHIDEIGSLRWATPIAGVELTDVVFGTKNGRLVVAEATVLGGDDTVEHVDRLDSVDDVVHDLRNLDDPVRMSINGEDYEVNGFSLHVTSNGATAIGDFTGMRVSTGEPTTRMGGGPGGPGNACCFNQPLVMCMPDTCTGTCGEDPVTLECVCENGTGTCNLEVVALCEDILGICSANDGTCVNIPGTIDCECTEGCKSKGGGKP